MASYCIIKGIVESSGTGAGVFVAVFMTGTVVQTDLGPSMITHEMYNACTILCYIAQCCSLGSNIERQVHAWWSGANFGKGRGDDRLLCLMLTMAL